MKEQWRTLRYWTQKCKWGNYFHPLLLRVTKTSQGTVRHSFNSQKLCLPQHSKMNFAVVAKLLSNAGKGVEEVSIAFQTVTLSSYTNVFHWVESGQPERIPEIKLLETSNDSCSVLIDTAIDTAKKDLLAADNQTHQTITYICSTSCKNDSLRKNSNVLATEDDYQTRMFYRD